MALKLGRPRKLPKRTRAEIAAMTPDEKREHVRAINREKKRRQRRRERVAPAPITTARRRRQEEGARLFTWERLLPYIDKRADGHWIWLGPFRATFGVVRPIARAGAVGREHVDFIVCCLSHGPPPPHCFAKRLCDEIACVAPEHIGWSNRVLERAKRRIRHEQETA